MSPRFIFEQELEELKNKVAEMGECAEISYDKLFLAMKENNRDKLTALLDNDRQMMDMLRGIEAQCLHLMTKQQPVAKDMRLISASLKIVTDIERIGDHVSDIAELLLRRNKPLSTEGCDAILVSMMEETKTMLREAIEAFVDGDEPTAQMVIDSDDVVDAHFNQVKECIMKGLQQQLPDADMVVDNLMIAKYLEKMGDHAVNIGQWTVFQCTGDIDGVSLY